MNLEQLTNKLDIKYYNNLIKYCRKTNTSHDFFSNKIKELNEISDSLTETETCIKENNTSEVAEIVYSDDYLYKKPWTKLSNVHKIIKIKEFVSKLLIDDKQDKDELKNNLVKLVKCRVLTKKDKVTYDSAKGQVISIPSLSYKNGKYIIKK